MRTWQEILDLRLHPDYSLWREVSVPHYTPIDLIDTANGKRLSHNIGCAIYKSLKGAKATRHWESLVDYSLKQLKQRLEGQFRDGMNWDNYGEWHIDHMIPVSAFRFNGAEDYDFKRCWALSNLQPLWAEDNMRKHNKLTGQFQPLLIC